jgi:hypothetical protein
MTGELINTLEAPGEFDALTKLRHGETYFLLIARDGLAPGLVKQWADQNRRRALNDFDEGKIDGEERNRELSKSTEAEMIACDMRAYKKGHAAASSETVEKPPSYTGAELSDETKHRDAVQSARIKAASALNGAVAALVDLQELDTVAFNEYCTLAQCGPRDLDRLSDAVKPKRPGIDR